MSHEIEIPVPSAVILHYNTVYLGLTQQNVSGQRRHYIH